MAYTPVMAYDMVKLVQYIEETTEGTFPASGNMVFIAPTALFSLMSDKGAVPVFSIGQRDPAAILEGRRISGFALRFYPTNTTFLKYAFNLAVGAGTIFTTLSFAAQITIGGVVYYFTAVHARVITATITGTPGSPLVADVYVTCKSPAFSTTAPGPTFQSLSGTPLMFYSGGTNPITWGVNNFDTTNIVARVDNNGTPIYIMGDKDYKQIQPGARDFSVMASGVFKSTTFWTDYAAFTPATFTWALDSVGPKTIAVTAGQLVSLRDLSFDVADLTTMGRFGRGGGPVNETYTIFGTSIALT